PGTAGVDAHWLYRFLRVFAGRSDLGLSQRSVSQSRARQRPEPRQLFPLDHERADFLDVPAHGGIFRRLPVRLFLRDDGGAILRRALLLSGNEGNFARRNAEKTKNCLAAAGGLCGSRGEALAGVVAPGAGRVELQVSLPMIAGFVEGT